jgi:UDP-N-acetylmuramate dehydrogenase
MQIQQNVSLKPYNTFGIDAIAENFIEVNDEQNIPAIAEDFSLPKEKKVLGGGSNVLLTGNVNGLLLHNKLKGIETVEEDEQHVYLKVSSGEVWHELVLHAINQGWAGIENLALIPGTAGASPMQNIGAYGVEARETIAEVRFWHWEERQFATLSNADCQFGYRDSIFKHQLKDKVFITSVTYRLNKKPQFNTSYGAISQELEKMGITELSTKAIAQAVINIRSSKLPDPQQIGNAGSFFKNPTIGKEQFLKLQEQYPDIPSYPVDEQTIKIPAGWLIEQCGWKGKREGDAGVHAKQALVLVNYGNAQGSEIWKLSGEVLLSVQDKFGIELEREVQVW